VEAEAHGQMDGANPNIRVPDEQQLKCADRKDQELRSKRLFDHHRLREQRKYPDEDGHAMSSAIAVDDEEVLRGGEG